MPVANFQVYFAIFMKLRTDRISEKHDKLFRPFREQQRNPARPGREIDGKV
jgi:hypothetical protein